MTKLQIISKLWSAIYDLLFLIDGMPAKTIEEIQQDLDLLEYYCRPYADADDIDDTCDVAQHREENAYGIERNQKLFD